MIFRSFVFLWAYLAMSSVAFADGECQKCMIDRMAGLPQSTAVSAAIGALGGGVVGGGLPGAVCGAVLGAVGNATAALLEAAKCKPICDAEGKHRNDSNTRKCEQLLKTNPN